jgi:hypothetical protein
MPLLLPNLDDRTWSDLVAEGTSLIPVYGPEWTNQNYSDPGITLVELLGYLAESYIYQTNQISDRERLRFLALVGVAPKPPVPAYAILSFKVADGVPPAALPITLPAGLEFAGLDAFGVSTPYRISQSLTLAQGAVTVLQAEDSSGYRDLTTSWRRRGAVNPFGSAPQPGMEFYIGLTAALPVSEAAQMFFTFGDGHSSFGDRRRLVCELEQRQKRCHPADNPCHKKAPGKPGPGSPPSDQYAAPKHYGVRTVWEYQAEVGGQLQWIALDPSKDEVVDRTRAFTLDGAVTFRVPQPMASAAVGEVAAASYYLRCRFDAGRYDAAPLLKDVALNGIVARQAVPSWSSFTIDVNAVIKYSAEGPPKPNDVTSLRVTLDSQTGRITQLSFGSVDGAPQFRILRFEAPGPKSTGMLALETVFLGFGTGLPHQPVNVPAAPVEASSVELYSLESDTWRRWELVPNFDASTRKDFHAVLDPTTGTIVFGNGERGRVPPPGCEVFAIVQTTRAQAGNLSATLINTLADSLHNRALLYNYPPGTIDGWSKLRDELAGITNDLPAWGGAAAQTIAQAAGGADQLVESSGRAVTLNDYEQLAANTPGTRIARVTAIANMHPDFPCFSAPGMITVIVLPHLPQGQPMPSPGLLQAVSAYLRPRRVIGTRVEAVTPTYLDVAVQATVQSLTGSNRTSLQQAIVTALNSFLDPLIGGPAGTGWPFGRDVYRSEIMKVIDAVPGVDYVASLALLADGGQAQCGNVCVGPITLVAAGTHQITVL